MGVAYHNFASASDLDPIVYGASRPGIGCVQAIPDATVEEWCSFMALHGIRRVLVLLHSGQLPYYQGDLLGQYARHFPTVIWAPIPDFEVPPVESLEKAMSALHSAIEEREPIVVHCSAGMGRTGIILASWLVTRYGLTPEEAVERVVQHAAGLGAIRVPTEAPGSMEFLRGVYSGFRSLPE